MIDAVKLASISTLIDKQIVERKEARSDHLTFESGYNHGYLECLLRLKAYLGQCIVSEEFQSE